MTKPEVNLALYSRHHHNPSRRGVAIYTHEMVKEMANLLRGTKVFLLDCFWRRKNYEHMPRTSNPNFETRVLHCPGRIFDTLNRHFNWPRVEMVTGELDLMHVMHEQIPGTRSKHLVVTVHGLGPLLYPELFSPGFRKKWAELLTRSLKKATKVITVSKTVERQLLHYHPEYSHKYVTSYLGVAKGFLAEADSQEGKKFLLSNNIDFPYILYVGAADSGKNLVVLLKAFSLFLSMQEPNPPHHLVLVGNAYWGGYSEVRQRISELALADRVHFTGYIDHKCLPSLYRGCDLFVFPSLFEGFGLPLLEAMASGAPCLVSNRPALDEVGGDIAAYFDPQSPEDLAYKMKLVLESPDKLADMRVRGREYARHFTWERTARATIKIYEEILGTAIC